MTRPVMLSTLESSVRPFISHVPTNLSSRLSAGSGFCARSIAGFFSADLEPVFDISHLQSWLSENAGPFDTTSAIMSSQQRGFIGENGFLVRTRQEFRSREG